MNISVYITLSRKHGVKIQIECIIVVLSIRQFQKSDSYM